MLYINNTSQLLPSGNQLLYNYSTNYLNLWRTNQFCDIYLSCCCIFQISSTFRLLDFRELWVYCSNLLRFAATVLAMSAEVMKVYLYYNMMHAVICTCMSVCLSIADYPYLLNFFMCDADILLVKS